MVIAIKEIMAVTRMTATNVTMATIKMVKTLIHGDCNYTCIVPVEETKNA